MAAVTLTLGWTLLLPCWELAWPLGLLRTSALRAAFKLIKANGVFRSLLMKLWDF